MVLDERSKALLLDLIAHYRAVTGLKGILLRWLLPKELKSNLELADRTIDSKEVSYELLYSFFKLCHHCVNNNPFTDWKMTPFKSMATWLVNTIFPFLRKFVDSPAVSQCATINQFARNIPVEDQEQFSFQLFFRLTNAFYKDASTCATILQLLRPELQTINMQNFTYQSQIIEELTVLILTDVRPAEALNIFCKIKQNALDQDAVGQEAFYQTLHRLVQLRALSILNLQTWDKFNLDFHRDIEVVKKRAALPLDLSRDPFVSSYLTTYARVDEGLDQDGLRALLNLSMSPLHCYPSLVHHIMRSNDPARTFETWQELTTDKAQGQAYLKLISFIEALPGSITLEQRVSYLYKILECELDESYIISDSLTALAPGLQTSDNLDRYFDNILLFIEDEKEASEAFPLPPPREITQAYLDSVFARGMERQREDEAYLREARALLMRADDSHATGRHSLFHQLIGRERFNIHYDYRPK